MWRDRFLVAWRTGMQALFALTVAWLVGHGIRVDPQLSGWLELAAVAAGAGVWAGVTHWLQTRTGSAWWAVTARTVARWLLAGPAAAPTYPAPVREVGRHAVEEGGH